MLKRLRVLALQAKADPPGDHVRRDRAGDHQHPGYPGDGVQRHVELVGDHVVGALGPQHAVEHDHGHADPGARGRVARPVVDVVLGLVAGDPALEERPGRRAAEDDPQRQRERDQHRQRQRVAEEVDLPGGHDAQRPLQDAQVPVGLAGRGDRQRGVRAVQPDRVDLRERRQHGQRAEDEEEPRGALEQEVRVERLAPDRALGVAERRHRGVLLVEGDEDVRRHQRQEQPGDEQHVQ